MDGPRSAPESQQIQRFRVLDATGRYGRHGIHLSVPRISFRTDPWSGAKGRPETVSITKPHERAAGRHFCVARVRDGEFLA
jgi:hypothetical protein